jgi:putative Mn2+ efflux pump MntP
MHMTPITIGILAFGMSVDAFIASLGRGAATQHPGFGRALKTGAIFGIVEAITPLIGWLLGHAASPYVAAIDHWIAFGLLAVVGLHMGLSALRPGERETRPVSTWAIIAIAIGTSIDAMAVGMSLAFLDVNILIVALSIGLATLVMSSTGILAGRFLGRRFGQTIEIVGALMLIGLGTVILFEHLLAA